VTSQANFDPATEEYQLFAAVLSAYGDGAKPSPVSSSGFAGVLGAVRLLNAATITDYSSAGMIAAVKTAPAVKVPLGGGADMKCTGTVSPFGPGICSDFATFGDAEADGSI